MKKKLKLVFVSIFIIAMLISTATAIPICQQSKVVNRENYLETIKNKYDKYEKLFNSNLYETLSNLINKKSKNQEIDFREITKSIIDLYEKSNYKNNNGKNIEQFYFHELVFKTIRLLQLNQPTSSWRNFIVPFILILYFGTFSLLQFAGFMDITIQSAVFVSIVPFLYILSVYASGWFLTIDGIEIILKVENSDGEPITGLDIKAVPWDTTIEEYNFEFYESTEVPGLYTIPGRHIEGVDVPPGIFDFSINGNGEEYPYKFNNSKSPIYPTEKYFKTITIN